MLFKMFKKMKRRYVISLIFIVVLISLFVTIVLIKGDFINIEFLEHSFLDGILISAESFEESEVIHLNYQTNIYDLGNGKFVQISFLGFANYHNGSEYLPIETQIVNSSDPLFDYEVTKGIYQSYFKENPTEGQVVKFMIDSEYITYQPIALSYRNDLSQLQQINMVQEVIGVPNNNSFLYKDAYGENIDLQYSYWNDYLREELIINSLSDLTSPEQYIIEGGNPTLDLDFILTTNSNKILIDGVDWDKSSEIETSNEVYIKDDLGNVIYYLKKLYAYDSNNSMQPLTYNFRKVGQDLFVTIKTPYSWISNISRVYPIYIDPDTGFEFPGTTGQSGSDESWTDTDNIKADDGSNAYCNMNPYTYSNYLEATNFGFSVSGATIDGIEAVIEHYENEAEGVHENFQLIKGGVIGGDNNPDPSMPTGSMSTHTAGGSEDLWGETWDAEDIESSDFGIATRYYYPHFAGGQTVRVDYLKIKVYYTEGPSDTCTCTSGSNWEINMSDYCILSTACSPSNVTFIDVGNFTCDAVLNATSVEGLSASQRGYVTSNCRGMDR